MKAAILEAFMQPLVVREVPDPTPAPDGVVLRVKANGICRTDWHAWMGDFAMMPLPRILGHEFCGVVEAVGKDVTRFKVGDRVIVPFTTGDGTCPMCQSGHANLCDNLTMPGAAWDGGYAELCAVPRANANLIHLPESVDFVEAASMGCRFMTAFHGVVDQVQVKPGEWVAVHGCGGIGLSAIHIATAMGANVIAVDLDSAKLDLARQLGAAEVVNAKEVNPVEAIMGITGGGAHVAVDALGIAQTCTNALFSLRKRGRSLQIGLTTKAEKGVVGVPIDMIVAKELQLIGSLGMQPSRFPEMLRMVERGRLQPGKLVTGQVSLEEAGAIVESMTNFQTVGINVITRW